ncbi:hypothetical protein QYQ99_23590 [Comamonas testosteroni]|uniref:hypothetical protein n=1 Tax=Comamonas testosteroni TaxID=285 RepID=UPI00265E08BD|nr:hypothetical protein [Comamonas testosteroni]WKL15302.1 hypothetical protein QYQ99_23590 [Comamonas testosteroni]
MVFIVGFSSRKSREFQSLICKYQPSAQPWELVCGAVHPGRRRIADGVQARIPAAGMTGMSGGTRVAIKGDGDQSLLAQDSSFYI